MKWGYKESQEWSNEVPKKIKKEGLKFKIKLLVGLVIGIIIFFTCSGCIVTKKGHSLGGGYIKGPDGVYRKAQTLTPLPLPPLPDLPPVKIAPPQSKPIELKPVISRPVIPKGNSAVAKPTPVEAKSSPEKLPPFTSTVSSAKEINLGLIKITLPEDKDSTKNVTNNLQVAATSETAPKSDYSRLFAYYFICSLVFLAIWAAHKLYNKHKGTKQDDGGRKKKTARNRRTNRKK